MARLLFVNHTGRLGGPSYSLLKILKYLRAEHEVAVFIPDAGRLSSALEQEDISWHVSRFRYRYVPALAYFIWRGKFDLVYGNNFSRAAYLALIAAKLLRKPFVWHIREVFKQSHAEPRLYRRVRHADAVIAVSEASARSVKHYVPGKDVSVIYNGVEVEDFTIPRSQARSHVCRELNVDDGVIILNVGAICHRKNQLLAIEAAAGVIKNHPSVRLCFLGRFQDLDYVARLKEQAARYGIEDNIHLLGFRDDLTKFLRGADILLHVPSWDPHPRSVIEGMAAELPVVAHNAPGGISETVVPGQTGYLVPFGDVQGITQAVEELVVKPSLRRQMGKRGRERVERMFTAERTSQQIEAVIEDVLQR